MIATLGVVLLIKKTRLGLVELGASADKVAISWKRDRPAGLTWNN
jgi:hypothetical protein